MPIVQLPDGTLVQLPDPPKEEEGIDWKSISGFAKESGKSLLRGLGGALEQVKNLPPIQAQLALQKAMGKGKVPDLEKTSVAGTVLPREEGGSPAEKIWTAGMEGAGGAMAGGLAGANPIKLGLAGAAGGMAGEGTDQFLASQNPALRKAASLAAALVAGGGAGYALGPRPTRTPQQAVSDDTQLLNDIAMGRVNPTQVDPARVANLATDAANRFLQNVRQQRTNAFEGIVQGETVRPFHLSMVSQGLRRLANQPGTRPEEAAALNEMAASLRDSRGNYLTDLGQISLALKTRKDNPPPLTSATSRTIPAGDLSNAYHIAQTAVEDINPALRRANRVYRYLSNTQVNPLQESPIGKIADRNPNSPAYPTPTSRLEAIVADQNPQGVEQTMLQLGTSGADRNEIARALLQRRLSEGSARPGMRVYGAPGSGQEANFDALMRSAQVSPEAVRAPLRAADTLANTLPPPQNATEYLSVHPKGVSLRGIFRPGFFQQSAASSDFKRQIAQIMATASPQEMEQLRRLAMFDSDVRKALTGLTAFSSAQATDNQGGK